MPTTEAALYRLLSWLSPAYPLGGFSYSHGIETAVEAGLVRDAASLQRYVATVLRAGAGRSDAALLVAAYRAAADGDARLLDETAELAAAWRGTTETALESQAQGAAFLAITRAAWPHRALDALAGRHETVALPVVIAVAAVAQEIPLEPLVGAYLHALASNLVSAGMRLIPLGQTDGQRAIAALEAPVAAAARASLVSSLDTVGTAAPLIERCSMRHETQYTRLFRS